ncbi:MAG: 3-carboxy-cis,cis-muconate cycloisomerase [Paracoccaceae bacterium]
MTSENVFSHAWLGGLFADAETAELLSAEQQLDHMRAVEIAYSQALGRTGSVEPALADAAVKAIKAATIKLPELRHGTGQDGVVVPEFVRALWEQSDKNLKPAIHTGMTSQDVVDTALVLSLSGIVNLFKSRLTGIISALDELNQQHGGNPLMGRTRMQAALPIKVSDRLRTWTDPLLTHSERLTQIEPRLLNLQLGGAVGNGVGLKGDPKALAADMAKTLGIGNPPNSWHTTRVSIAEFAGWLSLVTGSLGKMGQDIALMSQQRLDEVSLSKGGTSSSMAHKNNPVLAELLVTLGRYNATQLAGIHQSLIHEQERSGSAWALEWMILPQMIMTTGRSLTAAKSLCEQITRLGDP